MARRLPSARQPAAVPDEEYLRWRFSWLTRVHLLAPGHPQVAKEAARLRDLPAAEAVERLEDYLEDQGLLGRAVRMVESLERARERREAS